MSEKATETKPTVPETPAAPAVKTYSEAEYNALQEKLASTEKQLAEANTTIQSFKDMDIEGMKSGRRSSGMCLAITTRFGSQASIPMGWVAYRELYLSQEIVA